MTATRSTISTLLFSIIISVTAVPHLCAQDAGASTARSQGAALKSLSLEELGDIEITSARKRPDTVWQTAAAVYVITQEDIRRSGATTLPDALRLAPGVIVNQSDSNRWAVGIRGFADIFSKGVLVLIDGRSVYTPLVGGVHWAIQDLLLADVERIEVIRGPGGTIWGANAMNGVINVITTSAEQTHGPRLTLASGNVEQGRASFRYGGSRGHSFDYRVYGKWLMRGAQFHADDANFDVWRSAQSGFRSDWRPTSRDTVTVSADIYKTNVGERSQVSSYTPPSIQTVDGTLHLTGGNLIGRWERRFAGGSHARVQTYFDRTNREGFTFSEARNTFDVDFNVRHAPRKRQELAWGAGARVSPSTITQVVPTLNFLPNKQSHTLTSAFVEDEISVVPKYVSVSAGIKFEHNSYTGPELLPSARVLWTPGSHQSVWASVTRAVRTPSRFERDLRFAVLIDPSVPLYVAINGNADFASETVIGSELGYRTLLTRDLYVDVTAFHNAYDGLAGFGDAADPVVATVPITHVLATLPFANSIAGTTDGFEITPDWKPFAFWQLKGSYSYLRLAAHNKPGFTGESQIAAYRGLSPRHQVRAQSHVDLPHRVEVDQTYRYVDALTGTTVRAYHALDLRAGWRFAPHVLLSVVGQNLLQPHHAEFNAVPVEIRRAAYAQLVFTK